MSWQTIVARFLFGESRVELKRYFAEAVTVRAQGKLCCPTVNAAVQGKDYAVSSAVSICPD
jgi:hypothetical protein